MTIAIFNHSEAVFWWLIAGVIFIRARKSDDRSRKIAQIAGKVFILFGLTDFIEAETGAWWDPRWLFFLKAVGVVTLIYCFVKYRELQGGGIDQEQ